MMGPGREDDAGGGEGFIPVLPRRAAGRLRGAQQAAAPAAPRHEGGRGQLQQGGVARGGQVAGRIQGGERRNVLPQEILRMMRRRENAKVVSLDFGSFVELPEPVLLHRWLKDLGFVGQIQEERKIDWVGRNEYEKKVIKEEQGAVV